ncbi:response regulator transcription factor [Prevotella dentasini]|uniref:response regulator transcription factor n=1 Tax=Prevotella dentasini TaxID=589537 RepID=UPI0011DD7D2F|nr:response regulator transcription factor [Prevotella dentasini]
MRANNEKIRLLIVEDDENLRFLEKTELEEIIGGYEVFTASNGKEGLEQWISCKPDIVVADIDMPVMDGFDMVEQIRRKDPVCLILFTSALTSPKDIKAGYRLGADNYIKKPFMPEELDAHIRAMLRLRNSMPAGRQEASLAIGAYVLVPTEAVLLNTHDDSRTSLSLRECQILELLAQNMGKTVERNVILERYWPNVDIHFASRSLDVFVSKLRKMVSGDPKVVIRSYAESDFE